MLNEASRLPGLTVYTRNGQRLGVVHDVLLDTTQRIISALLVTGTAPRLVKDGENIIIPYRWVQDLDDVVILRHFPKKIEMTKEQNQLFGIEKLNIKRSEIPAVTHVDYSARIQTVHEDTNPKYYSLISYFNDLTGCPMVVNTSFNVRGEPIVCTPADAFRCFMGTELDVLAIGNYLLYKTEQDLALKENYEEKYELD